MQPKTLRQSSKRLSNSGARNPLGAVMSLFAAIALCAAALSGNPARTQAAGAAGAVEWLIAALSKSFAKTGPSEAELAEQALAVRALASPSLAVEPARIEILRDRLGAEQREDGSFGSGSGSVPLTWLALGVFEGCARESDARRAQRARQWLAARESSRLDSSARSADTSDAVRRALGFLGTTSSTSSHASADLPSTLCTLAGGPFDLRAAYASAMVPLDKPASPTEAPPASRFFDSPLYALLHDMSVLDHYRTSHEAALLAESIRPMAVVVLALDSRRDLATGAWSDEAGGAPRIDATACALLIQEILAGWSTSSRSSEGDPVDARDSASEEQKALACEDCHQGLQPLQVAQWRDSAHADADVGCADCHGTNHSTIFREGGRVAPSSCARCHADEVAQFEGSKHAHAERTLQASALFQATPTAARAACIACHRIGEKQFDGGYGNCNYCHPGHGFDARQAREPEACTVCHTGDDYPQDLAFRLSKHGALHASGGDKRFAPTCATCHQPGGRHDDGYGIGLGASGNGATILGTPAAFHGARISNEDFARKRAEMLAVCTQCHSSRMAEASLRQADDLKREGDAHVLEAAGILRALESEGYFGSGAPLGLGPEHARPDPGRPGAILLERFYRMWRFHHATAWKGAYHQSASVANQGSGEGTLEDLEFIRAQAREWRARGTQR